MQNLNLGIAKMSVISESVTSQNHCIINWLIGLFLSRLVERLEKMKRCRNGSGETDCILCGEVFRFYHRSQRRCHDCNKMTCGKCGLEVGNKHPHGHPGSELASSAASSISSALSGWAGSLTGSPVMAAGSSSHHHHLQDNKNESVWLCKICAEEKEMWKKSGAWFFKVSLDLTNLDLT